MIVVMEKGRVVWIGDPSGLAVSKYSAFFSSTPSRQYLPSKEELSNQLQNLQHVDETPTSVEFTQEIVEEEFRKEGKVELSVYKLVTLVLA